MSAKVIRHIIVLSFLVLLFSGFTETNPYFIITSKDVAFQVPKGFPKPVYTFSKNKPSPERILSGPSAFVLNPILSK
jgi:hypothetical protein